ncbi:alpha-2-macroglobulin family protein [Leptospira sarikeiensis]|uniref:Alpha-2-macroglobulin n=1 Tax=Leptospira sarikeiensis TaxID=2484943 RepID=A0A4V3JRM1_9LEPT|nr:alpha-2-macroglobulin family protein [Leptospira sarikeiensis]TGL60872.1 alpha-2-macroglobulin [Leptospira sarikeiensis]
MRTFVLDHKKIIFSLLTIFISAVGFFYVKPNLFGAPAFYLGTDRSFGSGENAYVNLEGSGSVNYEFRVYKISDPQTFLTKKVRERLVQENNEGVFGNPVALFTKTAQKFQNDFRKVARKEFNSKTRSELRQTLGVDYEKPQEEKTLAIPAILKDQELVATFSVPTVTSHWAYRRIPVPVRDNGVYLVEGVSGSQLAYTILIKSGLNFLVKQADAETFVYVGRKDTGEPVSDVDLTLFNLETGQAFQTGKTSSDGTYFYKGRSPVKGLILAQKNGEYSVSDPEFYSSSFYGEGGPRAYLYTDRPVYRPGDTVYFKGIVRNFSQDDYKTISGAGVVAVASEQGETSIPSVPINVSGDNGTFSGEFVVPDSENVTLGNYSLILNFRDKVFQTEFSVEAYKKPTFLVSVSIPKSNYLQKEEVSALVKARYYYGQPVANQEVAYRVFRRPKFDYSPVGTINFDASSDYLEQSGQSDKQELVLDGKGKLDPKGQYSIKFKPDKTDADSVYTVIASVQSEDMTLDGSASFSVNRSAFFVRISKDNSVYEPGKDAKLTVSLIPYDKTLSETDRQKTVGNRNVDLILYNREIQYVREANRSKISSLSVMTSASGIGTASFTIPKRGQFVLVAETKDPNGNLTKSETFFWASSVSDSIEIPFKDITLKPGKDIYSVGDTAEILVLSPISNGHMVLTLEGNRIFKKEVVKMKGNALKYAVPITAEMSPNFTLSAVQFSGNDVYKSQVRVVAPPEQKFLKVDLEPRHKVYRPGDKAEIRLKTTGLGGGVSAEVSLAVVDEAIYQIKEERTPNIGTFFYHPRRNNVQTTLASAYKFFGYSEYKRLKLALGQKGDSVYSAMKNEDQARDRFKDTSYWNAKVKTGADGTATVSFDLPDNLTSWRITAVAITPDTKVGRGQTSFVTKKDLMILGGMPRFIIKGETQKVSATISNQTPSKLPIKVSFKAEGAKILGNSETTINLEPGQNQSLHFDVQTVADPKIKSAKISILAASGNYQDLLKSEIPLKTWGLPKTVSDSLGMEEGANSGILNLEAPKELGDPRLEIRLSPASLPALRQSLEYLAGYPYGCVEQTMSRFYPLLSAQKAGFINERLRKELPKMIEVGLKRVSELQRVDGGFGWFEGGIESDVLMSAYVYRGLAISQKNGAKVSAPVLNRARAYLYEVLGKGELSPNSRAYVIFSLSEGGAVEDSLVDGLVKSSSKLNQYGQALLSLILSNKGKKAEASTWFKKAVESSGYGKKPFLKLSSYGKNPRWEEDRIETISTLLSAGVRSGEDKVILANLASSLLSNRIELAWNNSRDTSAAVLALSEFLASIRESETTANVEIVFNGTNLKTVSLSPKSEQGELYKIPIPSELIRSGSNKVEILKKDGPVLYATASLYYTDRSKKLNAHSNGIKVKRTYYKLKVDSNDISTVESRSFQPGDLVMVEVSVEKENDSDSYYQVEDSLLPGFSFLQRDAEYYSGDLKMEYLSRQVYDDRAVFFVGGPTKAFKVRYFIRAEVGGKYKAIPARASLMYYSEVSGASSDDEISVGQ